MYGFDSNISEKDLLKLFIHFEEETVNTCFLLNPNVKEIQLYSLSSNFEGADINYNCGDGEETFKSKDFVPSSEIEKINKDILDCKNEFNEKSCSKTAYKLLTDDVQCCWCEITQKGDSYESSTQECDGYLTDGLEEKFKSYVKNSGATYNCSCFNKNGKITKASANSFTGEVIIN